MQSHDLERAIEHVERVLQALHRAFPRAAAEAWPLLRTLLRAHLEGRGLSVTALADGAGGPRSTARRAIFALKAQGLLAFHRVSPSGRRFHVRPSEKLLEAASRFGEDVLAAWLSHAPPAGAGGAAEAPPPDRPIAWPQPGPRDFDRGTTLRLLCYADPTFDILKRHRAEVEIFLGCNLRIESYPQPQYRERLRQALLGRGDTALVAVPFPWLAECAAERLLRPLDGLLAASSALAAGEFYEDAWSAGQLHGRTYAIALQPAVEFLWYRKDLLDAHGLAPPRDLAALRACARVLHAPKRRRWGIAWSAADGMPLAESFLQLLAAHGCTHPSDAPALAPELVAHLRALLPFTPPGLRRLDWERSARLFGRGEAAFCYGWSNRHGLLEPPELVQAGARVDVIEHPTLHGHPGHAPLGGALLAIPTRATPRQVRAAWTAIETLSSAELGKYFVLHGAAGHARFALARDRYVLQRNRLIGRMDDLARHGRLLRPPGPGQGRYLDFLQALSKQMEHLLFGPDEALPAALRAFAKAWPQWLAAGAGGRRRGA
jgi:multiple sugar transport system substrate-binding protein